jgi:phage-related protein
MTTATEFPDIDPTFATQAAITPRTLENTFGDGYEQRIGDGLNTIKEIWTVTFENVLWTEVLTINDFLKEQAGTLSFMWTPPGETALEVKCKQWQRSKTSGTTGTLSATFEQVFDL